jgi:hypothetical protein
MISQIPPQSVSFFVIYRLNIKALLASPNIRHLFVTPLALTTDQHTKTFDPIRLVAWPAGIRLGGGSLWYRPDCGTIQTVLLGAVHSHVTPGQLPGRSLVISRELQAGVLLLPPPEGHPGQLAYTFVIRILSTSRT